MKRLRLFLFGFLSSLILKLIGWTCKYKVEGAADFIQTAANEKCILMLWHNRLVMMTEILTRITPKFTYAALISGSRDGEILSYIANQCPIGRSIRVPHHSRSAALQTLIKEIKQTKDIVIITPDGPRGPAFQVKPGIVFAAKKTDARVVPLTWTASSYWRLSTWDGLIIPKPFSTIQVRLGSPLSLSEKETSKIEEGAEKLKEALDRL